MKYIATIDDRQIEVELLPDQQVSVDGELVEADFQSVANQPIYSLILNGQSYEASISASDEGLQVLLRGQLFNVSVEDERQRRLRQSSGGATDLSGEYNLKAPMPGLVVTIPVEEGQEIVSGDILLILESMKMQNELKAPRDGTVNRVRVHAGDSVDQNQILMILS
jgi:biotin carboxyl carrier protein